MSVSVCGRYGCRVFFVEFVIEAACSHVLALSEVGMDIFGKIVCEVI